jgi:hypothetical protein
MTQALYAHMNNKTIFKKRKTLKKKNWQFSGTARIRRSGTFYPFFFPFTFPGGWLIGCFCFLCETGSPLSSGIHIGWMLGL